MSDPIPFTPPPRPFPNAGALQLAIKAELASAQGGAIRLTVGTVRELINLLEAAKRCTYTEGE